MHNLDLIRNLDDLFSNECTLHKKIYFTIMHNITTTLLPDYTSLLLILQNNFYILKKNYLSFVIK